MSSIPDAHQAQQPLFAASSWGWTVACGLLKIAIAASALALSLTLGRPVPDLVGWMLIAGGAAEFALGWGAHRTVLGKVTLGSGLLTIVTGILFISSGWIGLFPLTTVSMLWLMLRGSVSLGVSVEARVEHAAEWFWLLLRSFTDLALGLMLMLRLPVAVVAAFLLSETKEMVSAFGMLLAISFAVAGIGLVVIGLRQRRREASLHCMSAPITA